MATRRLGEITGCLSARALGRRRATLARLLADWPLVVGPDLAQQTWPEAVRFGRDRDEGVTVVIGCPSVLAPVLSHGEATVRERLNAWFGYRAVARIRLVHRALPPRQAGIARPLRRPLTAAEAATVEAATQGLEDPDTVAVLRAFGAALLTRRP